jgi:hypothetical protein
MTTALALGLATLGPPARAQASIDYTLTAHHVPTTGATLSPFTLVHADTGAGALGESVIDQVDTARLSAQTPAGVHFALSSGALAGDPAEMERFLDTPAVPEPSQAVLCMAGLAVLLVIPRRRRSVPADSRRPGVGVALVTAPALLPLAGGAQEVTFKAGAMVGACGGNGVNAVSVQLPGSHAAASNSGAVIDLADGVSALADGEARAAANGDTGTLHTLAYANNTH